MITLGFVAANKALHILEPTLRSWPVLRNVIDGHTDRASQTETDRDRDTGTGRGFYRTGENHADNRRSNNNKREIWPHSNFCKKYGLYANGPAFQQPTFIPGRSGIPSGYMLSACAESLIRLLGARPSPWSNKQTGAHEIIATHATIVRYHSCVFTRYRLKRQWILRLASTVHERYTQLFVSSQQQSLSLTYRGQGGRSYVNVDFTRA